MSWSKLSLADLKNGTMDHGRQMTVGHGDGSGRSGSIVFRPSSFSVLVAANRTWRTALILGAVLSMVGVMLLWQGRAVGSLEAPALVVQASDRGAEAGTDSAPQAQVVDASAAEASRTISYTYDDAGRLIQVDYGDGVAISYTYDSGGNLLTREVVRHQNFLPDVRR